MSLKDKENKSLQDKLKHYFKKTTSGSEGFKTRANYVITTEIERDLSMQTPINRRLKVMKDITDNILNNRLEDNGVEKLWVLTKDLLTADNREHRQVVFNFFRYVITGQYEQLNVMRGVLFRFIRDHNISEDNHLRFELLHCLTENGKDIKCFEEEIARFMLDWMPQIQSPGHIQDFLSMIVNMVKYNAAYLDEDVVSGIVNNCCYLCCYSSRPQVVLSCLQVLEATVSYAIFPHEALHTFVAALCRTVNIEQYCPTSWKIMRNVLGTDLGHAALYMMCEVLRDRSSDAGLTRGAVFYINMALWGGKRVATLKATHASVLPAFLYALEGNQSVVTFEVVLALQSLINKHGHELYEPAWDVIFSILHKIIQQIEGMTTPNPLIVSHLHETITTIEQMIEKRQYNGNVPMLYSLIDRCAHTRPEQSVLKLIKYRASLIQPTCHDWLVQFSQLSDKYTRHETRTPIRTHMLHTMHNILKLNSYGFEEELLDRVVIPTMQHVALDADVTIRASSAKILLDMALHSNSKGCTELLDILERQLNRPFDLYVTNEGISLQADTDISDIRIVVNGLINLFHYKLFKLPSSHAVRVYLILVKHLELHYGRPSLFENHPYVRTKILELFLSARANAYCQIGFCYDQSGNQVIGSKVNVKPSFSPYVYVEGGLVSSNESTNKALGTHSPITVLHQQSVSYVSIRKACKLIIVCLKFEKDWSVLQMVLKEIPNVMQNKALILSKQNNDIDLLATALCSLVIEKQLWAGRASISEVQGAGLAALACVAPYHANLDSQTQQKIVKCLIKYGLVLRSPQVISALTIYTLETRETMVKMLPEVLLELSKISDTSLIAGPILEFLSTLTRLPKVFASFVDDQYMSVFAILLPYTNPNRYNHYIVSLAHHVIAAWFLKCRLTYRRDFVTFIIHGLHNNILLPFEEAKFKRTDFPNTLNEDSSNRMRSSSLGSKRSAIDTRRSASAAFHLELTETCVDLMARYAFSPCSLKPRRSPTADFMFAGGQSQTWLIGHKLVTITTSGCLQNSLKYGLCDRCLSLCKQHIDSLPSPNITSGNSLDASESNKSENQINLEIKRYTKYSLQHSRSIETCSSMSDNSLQPPVSGQTTRQNSSENKSQSSDVLVGQPASPKIVTEQPEVQSQLNLKLETLSKQSSGAQEERSHPWSRVLGLMGASNSNNTSGSNCGQCTCWCSGWAEIYVRRPTGDVAWVMRMQNQMNFDSLLESPLSDIESILAPSLHTSGLNYLFSDSKNDAVSDSDSRSRSGSSSSARESQELHKSNSDTTVPTSTPLPVATAVESREATAVTTTSAVTVQTANLTLHTRSMSSTEPINIPGSPQRQSSSSTTTINDVEDVDIGTHHESGKSRHPVRRSNSSPEMSSGWKSQFHSREKLESDLNQVEALNKPLIQTVGAKELDPEYVSADININHQNQPVQQQQHHPQKKTCKKSDMRVSCEAIPEEMCTTPPHPLMTYNSDPGCVPALLTTDPKMKKCETSTSSDHINKSTITVPSVPVDVNRPIEKQVQIQKIITAQAIDDNGRGGKPPASPIRSKPVTKILDDLPPLSRSKRSYTISVMSPTRKRRENTGGREWVSRGGGGLTPAFVLLQLYQQTDVATKSNGSERPLLVSGAVNERTIKNLDFVPSSETYKIGVLYVGPGQQDNEIQILKNEFGSLRYAEFLRDLGTLIALEDADRHGLFLNVERGGRDGNFTYVWQDDIMQVQFHVATLMPNSESDPICNEKRKHIGNDFVSIVYNDSGAEFNIHTIKGQFNFCIVVIEPLEHGINRVSIRTKDERIQSKFLSQTDSKVISDQNVALLARQMALHCTLASLISQSLTGSEANPYASNSLERLRIIKRLRSRLIQEKNEKRKKEAYGSDLKRLNMDDFTEYTSMSKDGNT